MEKLIWSPSYSVGIGEIDQQHQRMFQLIDRLERQSMTSVHSEVLSEVLGDMIQYANEHFSTEERLLARHDYPDLEEHQAQHLVFLERAAELNFETVVAQTDTPANTLTFLRLWWHHHILNVDMQYRDYLREHGVD